ncbi:MAG: gamma-glutamyltransferase [Betaproteobacteria bacterium]|nr:gamma-glutamyltransferase [Betaproteobacteria bacterium]
MVAAAHPLAVDAGLRMLAQGGSAMDAAIAVQLVLNLVEPHASGLGGGAYLLHYDVQSNRIRAYDGRETAPFAATAELFLDAGGKPMPFRQAVVGGRSVGVPGVARLLELAHRRHGRLPWKTLFEPAIALAENGYPLSERVHRILARVPELTQDAQARALYFQADGSPKPAGAELRNPELAATLRALAADGARAFYRGDIARDIVAEVRAHPANPGAMREEDLAAYAVREVDALCRPYRSYRVCGMPPSSSGGIAVLQMLGILARFDLNALRPGSADAAHLIAEAGRLAFADRNRYAADDRFVRVPVEGLLDSAYLRERSALIRPEVSMKHAEAGIPPGAQLARANSMSLSESGTSHISIVDRDGNAVSMTTTIESSFGARLMVRGFLLNNQLTDFDFVPARDGVPVANRVEPGKRPRSSMAPTLVFDADGRLLLVIGSPGGSRIINYVLKALVAILDWNMDVQAAIDSPNLGSRNGPTELERGTAAEALAATLAAMGHPIRVTDMTSGLHGILRTPEGWSGGADPRREGVAKGR